MTQEQYKLFTGESVTYSDEDWAMLMSAAEMRLASFLCLEEFPELTDDNLDLVELLANFVSSVIHFQGGNGAVEEKRIRNFTIRFASSSAANAFSQISKQYGDVIDKYSACDIGISVERSERCHCDYAYGV